MALIGAGLLATASAATAATVASAGQYAGSVMWFASGNRDEEVFVNPYDFDVTRTDNDHVTFGKGSPHLCLGNLLAHRDSHHVRGADPAPVGHPPDR